MKSNKRYYFVIGLISFSLIIGFFDLDMLFAIDTELGLESTHIIQQYTIIESDTVTTSGDQRLFIKNNFSLMESDFKNDFYFGLKSIRDNLRINRDFKYANWKFKSNLNSTSRIYLSDREKYADYFEGWAELRSSSGKKNFDVELNGLGGMKYSTDKDYNYYRLRLDSKLRYSFSRFKYINFSIQVEKKSYATDRFTSYFQIDPYIDFSYTSSNGFYLQSEIRQKNKLTSKDKEDEAYRSHIISLYSSIPLISDLNFNTNLSFERLEYKEQDFVRYDYTNLYLRCGIEKFGLPFSFSVLPGLSYFYGDTFYFAEPYYDLSIEGNLNIFISKKLMLDISDQLGFRRYLDLPEFSFSSNYIFNEIMFNIKYYPIERFFFSTFGTYSPEWHTEPSDNLFLTYISAKIGYEF